MLSLLQIIKLLDKQGIEALRMYFEMGLVDVKEGHSTIENEVEQLKDFLFNHSGLDIEFTDSQLESLERVLENGSFRSAFNLAELK